MLKGNMITLNKSTSSSPKKIMSQRAGYKGSASTALLNEKCSISQREQCHQLGPNAALFCTAWCFVCTPCAFSWIAPATEIKQFHYEWRAEAALCPPASPSKDHPHGNTALISLGCILEGVRAWRCVWRDHQSVWERFLQITTVQFKSRRYRICVQLWVGTYLLPVHDLPGTIPQHCGELGGEVTAKQKQKHRKIQILKKRDNQSCW